MFNAASGEASDKPPAQVFGAPVDRSTERRLEVLELLRDPRAYPPNPGLASSGLDTSRLAAFLGLKGLDVLYKQVRVDPNDRGLANTPGPKGKMTAQGALAKRTSERGYRSLAFGGA